MIDGESAGTAGAGSAISLPKGGGAVHGLGEKFSADLFTGTGNLSVPLAVPPGRRGLQPKLALSYSTGHGNGPFGLGWSLALPGVSRRTASGVPTYTDTDTFVLSGADDLVRVSGAYPGRVRYRPRTEGAFARIEHVRDATGDYWEIRERGGTLTRYGTPRPAGAGADWLDPAAERDPGRPERVSGWRITETTDPLGNRVRYTYERDHGEDGGHRWDQPLLARIEYADYGDPADPSFLVRLDFGYEPRPDPFSAYRTGYEVRTSVRCRTIALTTHASDGIDRLAREYRLEYGEAAFNGASMLTRVEVVGVDESDGVRHEQRLPSLTFTYTGFDPARRRFVPLTGAGLPTGPVADPQLSLVDLYGTGLPDFVEFGAANRYWRNRGGGRFDLPRPMADMPPFAPGQPGVRLLDADGDGRVDLLVGRAGAGSLGGYFPHTSGGGWSGRSFQSYRRMPGVDLDDPAVKLVDLDGDGLTDVLRSGTRLECWFNDVDPRRAWQRTAAGRGPAVDLTDPRVHLADMTGDGLADIVLVENGSVAYWPNLGHGRWSDRVIMRRSPRLPVGFDPRHVLLGDVDGDGAADLVYVAGDRVLVWGNRSGNGWTEPVTIVGTPRLASSDQVVVADLHGTGMAGLLWSRAADAGHAARPRFLDLSGGVKPYLLSTVDNHLGARTTVEYRPSTVELQRDDARAATRWRTTLPIPVHVVSRVHTLDQITGGRLTTEYRYHHGYWDGLEREFRGFGMVEQLDTELVDAPDVHYSPPTLTRTWFHLGPVAAVETPDWVELDLSHEYWSGDPSALARPPEVTALLAGLSRSARRDALRALRGQVLRTELYALDGDSRQDRPYTVTESVSGVRAEPAIEPAAAANRVFFPFPVAQRTTQWERGSEPMSRFTFTAGHDPYGMPTGQLEVAVPRGRDPYQPEPTATEPYLATYAVSSYARRDDAGHYLVDRVSEEHTFEVRNDGRSSVTALRDATFGGNADLRVIAHRRTYYDGPAFTGLPLGALGEYGLVTRADSLAMTDEFLDTLGPRPCYLDPSGAAPWPAEYPAEFQALTTPLAGYAHHAGGYYLTTAAHRYDLHEAGRPARGLVLASRDPFGAESRFEYDGHDLLPIRAVDPAGLSSTAAYDSRVLLVREVTDANGNRTSVTFSPLGLITAQFIRGKDGEGDAVEPGLRLEYDLSAFADRGQPASVRSVRRLYHDTQTDVPLPQRDDVVVSVEFSDGLGRLIQTRALAEDTLVGDPVFGGAVIPVDQSLPVGQTVERTRQPGAPDNVTVTGWRIFDNKGRTVHAYEPFYSTGWDFAVPGEAELGQRETTFYDPRGHIVRTLHPDGSQERAVYGVPADLADPGSAAPTPWEMYSYDANDNAGRTHGAAAAAYQSHWNTPSSVVFDALGRTVQEVARNGTDVATWFVTTTTFDILGNVVAITDALDRTAFRYDVDLAGRRWRMDSIDAGRRDTVPDASDQPIESRDGRGALRLAAFDLLRRPVRVWARDGATGAVTLRQRIEYGDGGSADQPPAERAAARAHNLLGRAARQYDEAGLVTVSVVDFKGNVTGTARRVLADGPLLAAYAQAPANGWQVAPFVIDWQPASGKTLAEHEAALLAPAAYQASTAFDALNRIIRHTLPEGVDGVRRQLRPRYNRAGALDRMLLDNTVHVDRIHYDAAGRRVLLAHGNGVLTRFVYDPRTARLARLRSERAGQVLQDHRYDYDLAGNVLAIRDRTPGCGLPPVPDALDRRFSYDPTYRLLTATGRESEVTVDGLPWTDIPRGTDPTKTRPYTETYTYDPAGSLVRLAHASAAGYTRDIAVEAATNRVLQVTVGVTPFGYAHDANGNLTGETTTRHFAWNHADQLLAFATQTPGAEPSVHAQYRYDASGQRVTKLVRRQGGAVEVTHYIGGVFEHHRWSTSGGTVENNHVHVLDNRRRGALVRFGPAHPDDTGPATQVHLADHAGSAAVVVDGSGALVSREEYTPYGETTFGSFARKRYRYAGKERDEETGLCYHEARYLHPALGRWLSCDPAGPEYQYNLYRFAASSPLRYQDPTGMGDKQLEAIGNFLQEMADEFLETSNRRLPRESASPFGTRMHDILQGVVESAPLNAPDVPANRILTEVIIDPSGNVWSAGGKPGGAPRGSVTVDVAILEKGVKSTDNLVGRKAKDVLAAGIDYKTGAAKLADHQVAFFQRIKKPLLKLVKGGDLTQQLVGRSAPRNCRSAGNMPAGRTRQGGFVDPKLMSGIAEIGAVVLLQTLITGEAPEAQQLVQIGIEARYPILGISQAKDHGGTVVPITCYFVPKLCLGGLAVAGIAYGAYSFGSQVSEAVEKLPTTGAAFSTTMTRFRLHP